MIAPSNEHAESGLFSNLTYRSAKRLLEKQFSEAGLPFADQDALDLILGLAEFTKADYVLQGSEIVSQDFTQILQSAASRRLSGEPVDRILGWREFYGRRFFIHDVLSPRGDTEVLLLAALEALSDIQTPSFLDLGTGSGALAISLLCERTDASALATDNSIKALTTAQKNANQLRVLDRFESLRSDWYCSLPKKRFDAVLSNPPYIDSAAMRALETEVAEFDPADALHGGEDGLDPYRIIVPGARDYLKPNGWLGVEIGFDQRAAVTDLFKAEGFTEIRCHQDPAGLDRAVEGRFNG